MKKNIIAIIGIVLVIFSGSCIREYVTVNSKFITNNSEHTVKIYSYHKGSILDTTVVYAGASLEDRFKFRGKGVDVFIPFDSDSLLVIFDDTVSITHCREPHCATVSVKRSLYEEGNWAHEKNKEYEYHYEYVFTDEDYQEALNSQ